MKNFNVPRES